MKLITKIISGAIILMSVSISFTACKSTDVIGELNFFKTSTIKPEKQHNYDKTKTSYIEMQTAKQGKGKRKLDRQDVCLRFYGTKNGNLFTINEAYWFDNGSTGWTEISFAASGQIELHEDSSVFGYTVINLIVLDFPQAAKFRVKDSVLIGDDALKVLNNRLDRINSAVEFLKEPSEFIRSPRYIDYFSFEKKVGSYLFPEKYGYTEAAIKFGGKKKFGRNKGNYVIGDGSFWNLDYTQAAFPEYMWEVRNTGTLYKDWEQDFDLIYYIYNWEYFFGNDAKMGSIAKKSWK